MVRTSPEAIPGHNDSPVFGFAGFLMPAEEVRAFGTWFFQRKCELLEHELRRSGNHPAVWEKKGSSLYRAATMARYPALRSATNRLLNRIARARGRVFYAGVRKIRDSARHDSNALYSAMLREAVGRIDAFCREDCEATAGWCAHLRAPLGGGGEASRSGAPPPLWLRGLDAGCRVVHQHSAPVEQGSAEE